MDPKSGPLAPTDGAETSDAVLRFLESIGRRSEAEFYLALFRAASKESFANLVIGASVLRDGADAVVLDLRFLRGLGLVPVVSLGFGSSGPAGADQVERFHRRLERAEIPSQSYSSDTPSLADAVTESARNGVIPIVAFTSGDANDAVARFDALGDLSVALKTRKLIFVARRGGLRLRNPETELPIINLSTDYDKLVAKRALSPKRLFLLEQSRRLLVERATHRMFIAVTSPLLLLRELFTVRGAGTLIKRGSTILRKSGFADIDTSRLAALLQSSFGRELSPGFFEREMAQVYIEESLPRRGAHPPDLARSLPLQVRGGARGSRRRPWPRHLAARGQRPQKPLLAGTPRQPDRPFLRAGMRRHGPDRAVERLLEGAPARSHPGGHRHRPGRAGRFPRPTSLM